MSGIFQPPVFRPHPWIRGGHLQTIASLRIRAPSSLQPDRVRVELDDGDALVLHDDLPAGWQPGDPSIVMFHGLCGCHQSGYMTRLAHRFHGLGVRAFRVDMRGCGAAAELARQLPHAGRSEDVIAALAEVARRTTSGPLGAVGVSLGGNQLLLALGRVGAGTMSKPSWWPRLVRAAAVAPPIDLIACADQMQRWVLRPYNRYFIHQLLARVPMQVSLREDYQACIAGPRPRTLRQFDQQITAPLSGFADATDYYEQSSAKHVVSSNSIPTLVVAAADDPVVPVDCFETTSAAWSASAEVMVLRTGGHAGFIERGGGSWLDRAIARWFRPILPEASSFPDR